MSNGHFRTFDEFGWASTLSASVQRTAVQSAFDSGEANFLMPTCETVTIDAPLVIRTHRVNLIGGGGDLLSQANAVSQFRCPVANMEMLRIQADHVNVEGVNFHADAAGCTGVVMGDGVSWSRGITLERVTTSSSLLYGVHSIGAAGWAINKCWLWGGDSALRIESFFSDGGDNKLTDTDLNAGGAGLRWTSGGGLYMKGCKFGAGTNHIAVDWNKAASGGLVAVGNSFETCSGFSVDLRGSYGFERMMFVGNTWGVPTVAINAHSDLSTNWLRDLHISGNTIAMQGASPMIDLGCVDDAFVTGNTLRGDGTAIGIATRNGTGAIGPNRISGCSTPIYNAGGWAMTGQL